MSSCLCGFTSTAPGGVRWAPALPADCSLTDHFLEVLQNVTQEKVPFPTGEPRLLGDQRDMRASDAPPTETYVRNVWIPPAAAVFACF